MSDANVVARLIDEAGTQVFSLRYIRKDGTEGEAVFHAKVSYNLKGGEDSTKHIPVYRSLYNVQKKRWSKVNLQNITKARINGKTYKFQ